MSERHIVRVQPEVAQIPVLKQAIEDVAAAHHLSEADILAFTLAAEELLVNTARHGHSNPALESVTMELRIEGADAVMLYSDAGPEFDSATTPIALPPESLLQRRQGGLGLHMIRSTMHGVAYERIGAHDDEEARNLTTLHRAVGTPQLALHGTVTRRWYRSIAMNCAIERIDGVPLVTVSGRLDAGTAPAFDDAMAAVRSAPEQRILLDVAGLTYVSSAGLRSILFLVKHTAASGGRLGLCSVGHSVMEVIEISGFTSILDLYPDRDSALAASA